MKKTALTIAGADPSGWAGIKADFDAFSSFGVNGLFAIAALTAQNRNAVSSVMPVPPGFLRKEIETLLEGFKVDAVKVGMLGSSSNVLAVAALIGKKRLKNVVLDPVLRSTSGYPLMDKKGVKAIRALLPLVAVVTPNLEEASILAGVRIKDALDMEAAAQNISQEGALSVLVKGGHLKGSPLDILYDAGRFYHFEGRRVKGEKEIFHGTGCMLSSAIAAGLARGKSVRVAVEAAKRYVEGTLRERRS